MILLMKNYGLYVILNPFQSSPAGSNLMKKNTKKILKKLNIFGNLLKFQKVQTFTQYLKFIIRHDIIKSLSPLLLETVILHNF